MNLRRHSTWRLVCLGGLLAVAVCGLTIGRELLSRVIDQLHQLGPVAYYSAFALLTSLGVPPTPFLLVAGAAFDLPINIIGVTLSYAASLALSFRYASRLFRRQIKEFLAAKAPRLAGMIRENSATAVVLVRLTPGFPYALQNSLLASMGVPFGTFLVASLLPLVPLALLFVAFGRTFLAGNHGLVLGLGLLPYCVLLVSRIIARHRLPDLGEKRVAISLL